MDKREELIARSIPFLDAALIKAGIEEGWAADVEIDGRRYRRSRLREPGAETFHFSITAVYMDSTEPEPGGRRTYRGDYHLHPYGELNMVVPLNEGAALAGPNGWCEAGWTAPYAWGGETVGRSNSRISASGPTPASCRSIARPATNASPA